MRDLETIRMDPDDTPPDVECRLRRLLDAHGAPYEEIAHVSARSAVEAAAARGTPLHRGGKSVLMKLEGRGMVILVIPGDHRVSGRALRKNLGVDRYRFARAEELAAVLALAPGSVPPFGRPLFDVELVVCSHRANQAEIVFAMGRSDRSVRMATRDWLAIAQPQVITELSELAEG
jgi:Ala-tRNA(Pro) deacylase